MTDDTNIRIKRDTWAQLNKRKSAGGSFDEVINELLEDAESSEETAPT